MSLNELKPEDVIEKVERMAEVVSNQSEDNLFWDILALLREKDAEIERLREELQDVRRDRKDCADEFFFLLANCENHEARARDKAIDEFSERLKSFEFYEIADQYDGMQYVDFCDWVEKIAKELKGETP